MFSMEVKLETEKFRGCRWTALMAAVLGLVLLCSMNTAQAQGDPFAPGWDLNLERSSLAYQSIKKTSDGQLKVESNSFASFDAGIEPGGEVNMTVQLDSVDTKVDLRNVRMRFLFFETFRFPEATISMRLTPAMVADLPEKRRKAMTLPFVFEFHGVQADMVAEVAVTLLDEKRVSVASITPVSIGVADFGMLENLTKLEQAVGGVEIVPSATVTFDLHFTRREMAVEPEAPEAVEEAPVATSFALEPEGDFSAEACAGRFEVLSRTGNIYFRRASSRLQEDSFPLLRSVVDIVARCPELRVVIAGHTDSDGSDDANMWLSQARAQSVVDYLVQNGIQRDQLRAVGYGETAPVVPNTSEYNKSLNRRIEFYGVSST